MFDWHRAPIDNTGDYDADILNELREANGKERLRKCQCQQPITIGEAAGFECRCGAKERNAYLRSLDGESRG